MKKQRAICIGASSIALTLISIDILPSPLRNWRGFRNICQKSDRFPGDRSNDKNTQRTNPQYQR